MPSVQYSTGCVYQPEAMFDSGLPVSRILRGLDGSALNVYAMADLPSGIHSGDFAAIDCEAEIGGVGIPMNGARGMLFLLRKSGSGTAIQTIGMQINSAVDAGSLVYHNGILITDATGSGTLQSQIGIQIADLTKGSTENIGIRLSGGDPIQWRSSAAQIASSAAGELDITASDLKINGSSGWSGTFTNGDGDTVTVTNGIITDVS